MNKFDQILTGQIPISEIKSSLKFGTDRQYRVDKFMKAVKYELYQANTNAQFETTYQSILQSIYANGFEELHPYVENMRNKVLETRLPSSDSLQIQTKREEENKLREAYIESAFRVANPHTLPNNKPTTEQTTPNEINSKNEKWANRIFGKDIRKGILSNFWFWLLLTIFGSATIWSTCKTILVKLLYMLIKFLN
jgi:hypothetical protein